MPNYLDPAFVRINYQSAYGRHVMTIPTVPVSPSGPVGTGPNFVLRGAELPVTVDSAIQTFVGDYLRTYWLADTTFIDYIVFAQASPTAAPLPVASGSLGLNGTGDSHPSAPNNVVLGHKATQLTYTWRSEAYGLSKIVMLDAPVYRWDKVTNKSDGSVVDLDGYVTADASWLSARDDSQPGTFIGLTATLNEKLRRAYGMA